MEITLYSPLDMHLHLREGDMLKAITLPSINDFAAAVVMPNLRDPVDTLDKVRTYRKQIEFLVSEHAFEPLMTVFFRSFSRQELIALKSHIFAVKLYPAGVTTQSEKGISDFSAIEPTLEILQELKIPLLVHGETNGFVLDREKEFLPRVERMAQNFKDLRIVMEHISTRDSLRVLERYENIFATVTVQHLLFTLDDLAGGLLQPHLFCKPIVKRPADRQALLDAVLAGHPKIMFGSDSAPHPLDKKEAPGCAAGCFTAPIALPVLAELFERHEAMSRLQDFISGHAQKIHGLELLPKPVRLKKEPYKVPQTFGSVVPLLAGHTLSWRVSSRGD
jgi:dihydroorotase